MTDSTKEAAARLRAQFKARGWNARKVSVGVHYFSMGSSIDVTVRAPDVPLHEARRLAESVAEKSRWVHCNHSDEMKEVIGRRHADALERAVGACAASDCFVPVDGLPGIELLASGPHDVKVWLDGAFLRDIWRPTTEKGLLEASYMIAWRWAEAMAGAEA